jgi:probable HAF family extracellular repeat protein
MAINNRGDVVGFSDFSGDLSGGVLTPNFHAFLWTRETGRMTDIGVLPGDNLSEALDINDRGQVVGISIPSLHAFIYENGKLRDLNSLIPNNSPLMLLEGGGINDRGEITGQACVIADGNCPAGNNTPAFLAIPTDQCDNAEANAADAQTDNEETPEVIVSDSVRKQILRRLAFGHLEPEVVSQRK